MRIVEGDWVPLPATVERTATQVAVELNRRVIGDELFLLGLARLPDDSPARPVLDAEGVTADAVLAGVWVEGDDVPALLVRGLAALVDRLRGAGVAVTAGEGQFYVDDPFGNRVELLEQGGTLLGPP